MQRSGRLVPLFLSNALLAIGVIVFYVGLLRPRPLLTKPVASGYADIPPAPAPFNKLVFMVVDALRSDFVYGEQSGFMFTQELIRSNVAIPYTVHASSPSLTRSCVKAMTVGATPSFSDVISNVQKVSEVAGADTWLARLKQRDSEGMVFYGDDTWLQLYPGVFNRTHGVSTLWGPARGATDATITESALDKIHYANWSTMVLHYAGIDEIGHMGGPDSPLMLPKQVEMDGVVQAIYQAMTTEAHLTSTLFVLLGDHGMNEQGNHGGNEESETSAAMVFISPNLGQLSHRNEAPARPVQGSFGFYTTVEQYDIVPTLSGLLGIPISRNSRGLFIRDFLGLWGTMESQVSLVLQNIRQLASLAAVRESLSYAESADHDTPWETIERPSGPVNLTERLQSLYEVGGNMLQIIDSEAVRFSLLPLLLIGIACVIAALILSQIAYLQSHKYWSLDGGILAVVNVIHALIIFSIHGIRREDQFWCWTTQVWFGYIFLTRSKSANWRRTAVQAIPFFLQLITVRWNQRYYTHSFTTNPMPLYPAGGFGALWSLIALTYGMSGYRIMAQLSRNRHESLSITILTRGLLISLPLVSFLFKIFGIVNNLPKASEAVPRWMRWMDQPFMAQYVFLGIFATALYVLLSTRYRSPRYVEDKRIHWSPGLFETLLELLGIYLLTQSDPTNIPLFLVFRIQLHILASYDLPLTPLQTCVATILLSHSSFFAFGSSNSIGTLKYVNGFNGLHDYNAGIFLFHTLCSTWAGPIWWTCNTIRLLLSYRWKSDKGALPEHRDAHHPFFKWYVLQTAFMAGHILAIAVACVSQRRELDVRETMVPAFMYASLWVGVMHLVVGGGVCLGLWLSVVDGLEEICSGPCACRGTQVDYRKVP